MSLYVKQLALGPMKNFIYLFGAGGSDEVAVIDPAWDVEAILDAARADGKVVSAIFLTHHHHDHVNGVEPLLQRMPQLPAYAQAREIEFSPALQAFGSALRAVHPDEEVKAAGAEVRCLHTPGHTPGAHCLHVEGSLFTGDTLFVCGCGRCDLPGSDPRQMFDSLHRVLGALPAETVVYPGHDYGERPVSTLGEERAENPYLLRRDLESFIELRMRPRG